MGGGHLHLGASALSNWYNCRMSVSGKDTRRLLQLEISA